MSEHEKSPAATPAGTPVEELLGSEVIADAERRAERIRRRGERDAQHIREAAEKEAREASEAVLADARQRAGDVSKMVLATLAVEEQKATLSLKEEIIQKALDAAWQKPLAKDGYDYRGTLVRLAASAVSGMPGDEFTLELGEDDRGRIREDVCRSIEQAVAAQGGRAVHVHLSPTYSSIGGGCVVSGENGRLRYDNSFAARRRRLHDEMRRRAAQELFGNTEGGATSPHSND
jgi:vacuolar-type H+-ATPase subunit E/Vma4